VPPVVHAEDIVLVEEVGEFLAAELAVVRGDMLDQVGDAAAGVVAPGVADEEVVGHGFRIPQPTSDGVIAGSAAPDRSSHGCGREGRGESLRKGGRQRAEG